MPVLKVKNVSSGYYDKMFRWKTVLSDISIEFEKSSIYGLIGPNGAGKTTLFKTLIGLLPYHNGGIEFFGNKINDKGKGWLKKVGYVPEESLLPHHLTAYRFLHIYGGMKLSTTDNVKKIISEKMALVDLETELDKRIDTFSKGMKKRLMIAHALMGEPNLLILDEPFEGLDPKQRIKIKNLFLSYKGEGKTIIISSHELYELQDICDYAIMLKDGRIISYSPLEEFDMHDQFKE